MTVVIDLEQGRLHPSTHTYLYVCTTIYVYIQSYVIYIYIYNLGPLKRDTAICVYIHIYTYIYIYIIYIHMCVCVWHHNHQMGKERRGLYVPAYRPIYCTICLLQTHTHTYTHTQTHTHKRTHKRKHAHTHTHRRHPFVAQKLRLIKTGRHGCACCWDAPRKSNTNEGLCSPTNPKEQKHKLIWKTQATKLLPGPLSLRIPPCDDKR